MLKAKTVNEDSCPCEPDAGRKAVGVDSEIKASNLRRPGRIEGQVRGIQRMVEEDRYCADILTQITSAQEALRAVARALMRNHMSHCATARDDLQKCSLATDAGGRKYTLGTGLVSGLRDQSIQISAAISPGKSGGPVYDALVDLIGIVSSKLELLS